jgi:hypothetical protein
MLPALLFALQVIDLLIKLHELGYGHCDVKSLNCLVNVDPETGLILRMALGDYGCLTWLGTAEKAPVK